MKPNKSYHRYYENTFPKAGEFVMVKYSELTHFGTIVKLLEYNEIEGMVVHKEISSRSKDLSRSKLQARVGKVDVCVVLAVDEEKSFIDLSRTKVSEEDRVDTRKYFKLSKSLESVFNSLISNDDDTSKPSEDISKLYIQFAWPVYRDIEIHPIEALRLISQKHNHFDAFSDLQLEQIEKIDQIITSSTYLQSESSALPHQYDDEESFSTNDNNQPRKIIDVLQEILTRKFEQKVSFLRATVDVECFHQKGILAIREALRAAEDKVGVKIRMFNTPTYSIEVKFIGGKKDGEEKVRRANKVIEEVIEGYHGTCSRYLILD